MAGALDAGADAYLLKSNSYMTLPQAIRAVHLGQKSLAPELIQQMMDEYKRLASRQIQIDSGLTPQEVNILQLLAKGGRSQDIADELSLTEITVKRKIREITLKLDATNRVQAVAEAIRRGVV